MGKLTWKQFVEFWSSRGLKPGEAAKIIYDTWYTKNYTVSYGNIWKDPDNRKVFKSYVEYVYWYMRKNKLRWRKALLQLAAKQDNESEAQSFIEDTQKYVINQNTQTSV